MKYSIIILGLILSGIFLSECYPQTMKAADGADQKYLILNNDMKYYQIICKEHPDEYMSYYRTVREKIMQKLKHNYRDYYHNGDVNLFFVLKSNGALVRADVDLDRSTSDKKLVDIALLSLQQAASFPPFPCDLDVPQLPLSIIISFKENNE